MPVWLAFILGFALILVSVCRTYKQSRFGFFDDAFMFYRYALNFRQGFGWSWNQDGVHTYGMTSLTWQVVVLLVSFIFSTPVTGLIVASTLSYVVASCLFAWYIATRSASSWLNKYSSALLFITVPLELQPAFRAHVSNGMDTMMAFGVSAALACLSVELTRRNDTAFAVYTGVVAYLSIATRPESAFCALSVPVLLLLLAHGRSAFRQSVVHLATALALLAGQMFCAARYFGTPVPLAFYLKARHAYIGFVGYSGPSQQTVDMLSMSLVYLALLALFLDRRTLRPVLALLLPVFATSLYLSTVTQIMGGYGRYYAPYLPYVIIAGWLCLDGALSRNPVVTLTWRRLTALLLCLMLCSPSNVRYFVESQQHTYIATHPALPIPSLSTQAAPLLLVPVESAFNAMAKNVAGKMNAGSEMAASEVGFLGTAAPQVRILDLAGLNSRDQTMSGLHPNVLFTHNPDLIWMPPTDYSGMDGAILRDQRLLQRYDYIPGAFLYGIAIRKDSPQHDSIMHNVAVLWPKLYPGSNFQDYIVHTP